jgi:hypothetical protein
LALTEELTIEISEIPNGYCFRRSDGQQFFMVQQGDRGNAVLFAGSLPHRSPTEGIVEFDASISDTVTATKRWMLAYPDRP